MNVYNFIMDFISGRADSTPAKKVKQLPSTRKFIQDLLVDELNTADDEDRGTCLEVIRLLEYVNLYIPRLPEPVSCMGEKMTIAVIWKNDDKEVRAEMHYHGGFYWTAVGTGLRPGHSEHWGARIPDNQFLHHLRKLVPTADHCDEGQCDLPKVGCTCSCKDCK